MGTAQTQCERARWLTLGAIAGPAVFVLAWVVLGFMRPGYSIARQQVSALGVGRNGALMDAAFILGGFLLLAGVAGIIRSMRDDLGAKARRLCAVLLALPAIGMLWAGIFHMNRITLHSAGAELAFGGPVLGFLVVGLILRRAPRWRSIGNWLPLGSLLTLALLLGFTSASRAVLQSIQGGGHLGLWERGLILEVLTWHVILGWLALHDNRQTASYRH